MIAEYVKALLPSDWPITIGDLPSPNVEAVGIIEFDGYFNTQYFGMKYGTLITQPLVKIVARSASYRQGEAWMDEAKRRLSGYYAGKSEADLPDTYSATLVDDILVFRNTNSGTVSLENDNMSIDNPDPDEILSIKMVGTPTYLGRNPQKFHEFQVTFQVQVKE